MVIHRVWKGINPGTSIESLPQSVTAEDLAKQKLLATNSTNVLTALKKRFDHQKHQDPHHSLELLRYNIQTYFNKEIDNIMQKIIQLFILPAIKNIKESSGELVSDEQIQNICCSLLENSKTQYNTSSYMSSPVCSSMSCANSPEMEISDSSNCSSTTGNATSLLASALLKRKRTNSETENVSKRQFFLTPYFQATSSTLPIGNHSTPTANALQIVSTTTLPPFKSSFGPGSSTSSLTSALCAPKITTKEIVWSVSDITLDTLFVLDSQFSVEDTKDHLSNKYPQLIRYAPDGEDKNWLIEQNLVASLHSNSKNLLFVRDEVVKICGELIEYKHIAFENMQGFKLPEFMFNKVQQFFSTLNERGQFLLSVANQQNMNQLKILNSGTLTNAAKPPQQLLHIIQTQTGGNSSVRNYAGNSYSFCSIPQQQTQIKEIHTLQPQSTPNQVQKFIRSTALTSSHATLTALLSNQIQNAGGIENANHFKINQHPQQADHDG